MKFLKYLNIFKFLRDLGLQTKMIGLISGIVLISVVPLSVIVLDKNQAVVREKTLEVCKNLGNNISNLAREELLMDETYEATRTALSRLKESNVAGLLDSYVINIDGKYVAELNEKLLNAEVENKLELSYFLNLKKLEESEITKNNRKILRFSYPIFIKDYNQEEMRVGTSVFEFDKEQVYAPVEQIRKTIFQISGIAFATAIVIAALTALYFAKPIKKLSEGAQIIGSGKLDHRIYIKRRDELGKLATTFNQMTAQIQDFTQNLELKVKERTEELNKTLQEVQALKIAQDGDYYLTSLLLKPLQPNNNTSDFVKTDFYIEQKKKFKFRKWDAHIGGDICISDNIQLNGKNYTVFLNGDAMGKSIQGAGGALVLGVVFNAALKRSKLLRNERLFPEIWLKERFLDLHNVFISFEGSMYISICMGLIEEENGLMYYINAEHPWTVLFRDGKASFLEEQLALRKIGTPDQQDLFFVKLFQLLPEDVIITGSDGRDDLIIKNKDTGEDFVQEDETQFLRRVEEGDGDLTKVVEKIKGTGAIMDDFSLVKITYKGEMPSYITKSTNDKVASSIKKSKNLIEGGNKTEAIQILEHLLVEHKTLPELLKLLGRLYYNIKDYEKAAACFTQYIQLNPSEDEFLYILSNTERLLGNYEKAANYGERLYLRNHDHFLNVLNLAVVYIQLGVIGRARIMIEKAVEIDFDNKEVTELYKQIIKESAKKENKEANTKLIHDTSLKAHKLFRKRDYYSAIREYSNALKLDESNPKIYYWIAISFYSIKEFSDAQSYLKKSLALESKNKYARNKLVEIYIQNKEYRIAKQQCKKIIKKYPNYFPAQKNLELINKKESRGSSVKVGSL